MGVPASYLVDDKMGDCDDLLRKGTADLVAVPEAPVQATAPGEHSARHGQGQTVTLPASDGLESNLVDSTRPIVLENCHPREVELNPFGHMGFQHGIAKPKRAILSDSPRVYLSRLGQCERIAISTGDSRYFIAI